MVSVMAPAAALKQSGRPDCGTPRGIVCVREGCGKHRGTA